MVVKDKKDTYYYARITFKPIVFGSTGTNGSSSSNALRLTITKNYGKDDPISYHGSMYAVNLSSPILNSIQNEIWFTA